jgi:hypothetical protein
MADGQATPRALQTRFDRLAGRRDVLRRELADTDDRAAELDAWLALAPGVTAALEQLSDQLFEKITRLLEEKLTIALQEVLEQPISLKVKADNSRGNATISFSAERDGNAENILEGMGGSVANVLSVGLRLFALTTLDEKTHRRFLVLDEQDCWLRPDIVPRFVRIIGEAGRALGFQVLMISHHDAAVFEEHADRIIRLEPGAEGVRARIVYDRGAEAPHAGA